MSKHLTRVSEAQANAEALVRRSSTYADEHAASWQVQFGRPSHEMTTRELLVRLREALADEVPTKLHEAADHIDPGGVPAMTEAFIGYLDSRDNAVMGREPREDTQGRPLDPLIVGEFRKPLQAAIGGMKRSKGKVAWWGAIVDRIIIGSQAPVSAAMAEGSHPHEAVRTANEALAECYRRLTPTKMSLPRRERVA